MITPHVYFFFGFFCVYFSVIEGSLMPFLPSCTACPYPFSPSYLVFYMVILGGLWDLVFSSPHTRGVSLHGWLKTIYNVITLKGRFLLTKCGGGPYWLQPDMRAGKLADPPQWHAKSIYNWLHLFTFFLPASYQSCCLFFVFFSFQIEIVM